MKPGSLPGNGALPLWTTSSRLLRLGEELTFAFRLPPGAADGGLRIYPRYLEQGEPGSAFRPGGDLGWLTKLPAESLPLTFAGGLHPLH